MKQTINAPLRVKIKNSSKGLILVFKNKVYIFVALITGFFTSGFIIWSLNFNLVSYIIFDAPINFLEKIRFFWDVQISIYSAYSSPQASGIIIFGALFGINLSLIIYVMKNGNLRSVPKKVDLQHLWRPY